MAEDSEVMLQLAAEALRVGNFDLASEIYECQAAEARDARGRQELLVKRADALARAGRFTEAFGAYRLAADTERLQPGQMDLLTDCLLQRLVAQGVGNKAPGAAPEGALLGCPLCLSVLLEPVTLPCGHSCCRRCLEREHPLVCRVCGVGPVAAADGCRVNVVLTAALHKLCPGLERVGRLRSEADALWSESRAEEALAKYEQALRLAPGDHLLLSSRSQILTALRRWDQALSDAQTACRLQPRWAKGHVRKAQLLQALGRTEEALRDYLTGLSLDPDCRPARTEAQKLLSQILAPVSDQVPDQVLDYGGILSTRTHLKTCINTTATQQRVVDVERGILLKRKRRSSEAADEEEEQRKRARADGPSSEDAPALDPADLECSLCMRLFFEPVTTPCGHTFCLQCLERCLDHNPKCPLCKEELSEYLVRRQFSRTVLLEKLICQHLPLELTERQKLHQEELDELSNLNKSVPIFVCTMAFPTVPCPLHIFEPCYRLMIRRCRETGTNRFGMCLGDQSKGFADYGCLLEIRDVKFFSDGRSVVDSIGRRRFRVVQHQERDGYNTADIEYLEDTKVEGAAELELQRLHDAVYELGLVWVNSLRPEQKERIEGHFGPMPPKETDIKWSPNGPSWCWWLLAVLPLEGRAQLPFLAMTSLRDRLSGLRKVLLYMSQSRPDNRPQGRFR